MKTLFARETGETETAGRCGQECDETAGDEFATLLASLSEGELSELYGYDAVALVTAAVLELGLDDEHAREALWQS